MKTVMNIRTKLISFLLLTILTGCQKDDPEIEIPDFSHIRPQVTAKGSSNGTAVTKTVGTAGGEVLSADGRLRLSIPAGALQTNTSIGIQPLTNTAPLGIGQNYRLTPEGTVFTKPVTLTFSYDEAQLGTIIPDFLWVVTQNNDGTWAGGRKSTVNKNNKTVSVTTSHFSDWGVGRFMDIALKPSEATVRKGESVSLSLTGFKYDPDNEGDDFPPLGHIDSDLVGLNDAQQLLLSTEQFATFKVKNWTLNGASSPVNNNKGKLEVSGKTATYTAPGEIPDPATVTVSVNLEAKDNIGQRHGYSILSNITVVGDYYVKFTVEGKHYFYTPDAAKAGEKMTEAHLLNGKTLVITGAKKYTNDGKGQFTLMVDIGGPGSYPLTPPNKLSFNTDSYHPSTNEGRYIHFYSVLERSHNTCVQKDIVYTDISINIIKAGLAENAVEIVEGKFSGQLYEFSNKVTEQCMSQAPSVNVSCEFRQKLIRV